MRKEEMRYERKDYFYVAVASLLIHASSIVPAFSTLLVFGSRRIRPVVGKWC